MAYSLIFLEDNEAYCFTFTWYLDIMTVCPALCGVKGAQQLEMLCTQVHRQYNTQPPRHYYEYMKSDSELYAKTLHCRYLQDSC